MSVRQVFNKGFSTLYGASLLFRKCRFLSTPSARCHVLDTSKIMPRCCKGTAHGGVSVRSSTLLLRQFFQSHQATCLAQTTSLEVFAESHTGSRRHIPIRPARWKNFHCVAVTSLVVRILKFEPSRNAPYLSLSESGLRHNTTERGTQTHAQVSSASCFSQEGDLLVAISQSMCKNTRQQKGAVQVCVHSLLFAPK